MSNDLSPTAKALLALEATTNEPDWYARQLAVIPVPFRILEPPELQRAMAAVSQQLADAAGL